MMRQMTVFYMINKEITIMNESLSETYTYLLKTILKELLSQIVCSNHNYYVREA